MTSSTLRYESNMNPARNQRDPPAGQPASLDADPGIGRAGCVSARAPRLDDARWKTCAPANTPGWTRWDVYLDYTGGGVRAPPLDDHMAMLHSGVFGNPHSNNRPRAR